MNYLSLLCLLGVLLVGTSAYAIEGRWQSTDYNNTIIAVQAVSTGANGLNNYNLVVDGCNAPLPFAISQSYLKLSSLGKQNCGSGSGGFLMSSLQEKFFYFQIYYEQLLLVNIYGNKSLSFVRAKNDMRNYNLIGVFKTTANGSEVTITDQSIFLCNNSLKVDYSGNSKDSVRIDNSTITGKCQDSSGLQLLSQLEKAEYYRLENPSVLRLYGADYAEVAELDKIGKWNGVIPAIKTVSSHSNANNAVEVSNNKLNASSQTNDQGNQSSNQTGQPSGSLTATPILNGNPSSAGTPASTGAATSTGTDTSTGTTTSTATTTSTGTTTSTATTTSNAPPALKPASSTGNASAPASGTPTSTAVPTASTPSPPNISQNNTSQQSNLSTDYTTIKPSFSIIAAAWYPQYFMIPDQPSRPNRVSINGSSLAFIGCNPIIIPLNINYTNLTIVTGTAVPLSRKPNCDNKDQPYIDLIKKSNSVVATANETAFRLVFYDQNDKNLFTISRKMSATEKKNLFVDATNPSETTRAPNYAPQAIITTTNTTSSQSSSANSSSSTSTTSSNTQTTTTANNYGTTTTASSSTNTNSSSTQQSSSSTATSSSTTTTTTASTPSTSILAGRYNPRKVGVTPLPAVMTNNIFFIFIPTIIFVTGTCNNYVYPYNIEQKDTTTFIRIDTANRQVKNNSNCDPSDDQLFIKPFEGSSQITLNSNLVNAGNGASIVMNLMDGAGNPTISLGKVAVPNSS